MVTYGFEKQENLNTEIEIERLDNLIDDKNDEIIILKKTVKALAKMNLHYRIGKRSMPEWVFNNLDKAEIRYGNLIKII